MLDIIELFHYRGIGGNRMEKPLFDISNVIPDELSPAVWAYIGDAVYELYVRQRLVAGGPAKTKTLHHETTVRVRASFQAQLLTHLEPFLNEAELETVKRGRNVKSGHTPSSTDVVTYRHSTALEALIGYLFLQGKSERIQLLLDEVFAEIEKNQQMAGSK